VGLAAVIVCGLLIVAIAMTGPGAIRDALPIDNENLIARPHCDQLWSDPDVAAALGRRQDLVNRLEEIGSGVTVAISHPCDDDPAKAVITVTYASDHEWDAITAILPNDGFGAPVEVVKG
jgi:hypothetical protein